MTVMKMKMLNIIPYPKKVITNDSKAADINSAALKPPNLYRQLCYHLL